MIPNVAAIICLTNHKGFIPHHIMPLGIYSLGGRYTYTHMHLLRVCMHADTHTQTHTHARTHTDMHINVLQRITFKDPDACWAWPVSSLITTQLLFRISTKHQVVIEPNKSGRPKRQLTGTENSLEAIAAFNWILLIVTMHSLSHDFTGSASHG